MPHMSRIEPAITVTGHARHCKRIMASPSGRSHESVGILSWRIKPVSLNYVYNTEQWKKFGNTFVIVLLALND
jgi:hypothetical protein